MQPRQCVELGPRARRIAGSPNTVAGANKSIPRSHWRDSAFLTPSPRVAEHSWLQVIVRCLAKNLAPPGGHVNEGSSTDDDHEHHDRQASSVPAKVTELRREGEKIALLHANVVFKPRAAVAGTCGVEFRAKF